MIIYGHLGGALAGAFPLTMKWISLNQDSFVILAIVVELATISGLFANGAIDYYTKIYIPITQRGQKLALMGAITQVALLFGTTIGSIILTKLSFSESFIVISVCSITAAAICLFFLPEITIKNTENSNRKRHFFLLNYIYTLNILLYFL